MIFSTGEFGIILLILKQVIHTMDQFRTIVEIPEASCKINHRSVMMFIGSCFSDYIGEKMLYHKFNAQLNPFGVLYNPASIAGNINIIIEQRLFEPEDLIFHNGQWISLSHYTRFSHPNQQVCLNRINQGIKESHKILEKADFLFITFGTAWVYTFNNTGQIAANCHKIPASAFTRSLLKPQEIVDLFSGLLKSIKKFNNKLHIVFTLSPVRHWKDGAVGNQLSKSVLHYSIQDIINKNPDTSYFPAYEIFMDELRDYRFYADDMLHPSSFAVEYIWKRFSETLIDEESFPLMKEIEKVMQAVNHRPFNPNSLEHKSFLSNNLKKIEQLEAKYPFLDFNQEKKYFITIFSIFRT